MCHWRELKEGWGLTCSCCRCPGRDRNWRSCTAQIVCGKATEWAAVCDHCCLLCCAVLGCAVESFEHTDTEYLKMNDNASRDDG